MGLLILPPSLKIDLNLPGFILGTSWNCATIHTLFFYIDSLLTITICLRILKPTFYLTYILALFAYE